MISRRRFASSALLAAGSLAGVSGRAAAAADEAAGIPPVHCQLYPWTNWFAREGRDFYSDIGASLAEVAQSGADGFEPILTSPDEVSGMAAHLRTHGLAFRSFYVNSTLHDPRQSDAAIALALEIGRRARECGAEIAVTNPSPIRWGGTEDKNDAQLRHQAKALDTLGVELRGIGIRLAYHTHDSEMRAGAREFHHMLVNTDPENVGFCFDTHWVFRGCGDSEAAVFDILALYHDRIVEIHLRQSRGGTWTEAFGPGDVDHVRLAAELARHGLRPHLVLEQAIEKETESTMSAVGAHRAGLEFARSTFAAR